MDEDIPPTCRLCLDAREEFHHLAFDCPALWWERHTINAQDSDHSTPDSWTPQQILDFAMLPRVNEALAKPLYQIQGHVDHETPMDVDPSPTLDNPDDLASDSAASNMDTSSESDSSFQDDSENSLLSIE